MGHVRQVVQFLSKAGLRVKNTAMNLNNILDSYNFQANDLRERRLERAFTPIFPAQGQGIQDNRKGGRWVGL